LYSKIERFSASKRYRTAEIQRGVSYRSEVHKKKTARSNQRFSKRVYRHDVNGVAPQRNMRADDNAYAKNKTTGEGARSPAGFRTVVLLRRTRPGGDGILTGIRTPPPHFRIPGGRPQSRTTGKMLFSSRTRWSPGDPYILYVQKRIFTLAFKTAELKTRTIARRQRPKRCSRGYSRYQSRWYFRYTFVYWRTAINHDGISIILFVNRYTVTSFTHLLGFFHKHISVSFRQDV